MREINRIFIDSPSSNCMYINLVTTVLQTSVLLCSMHRSHICNHVYILINDCGFYGYKIPRFSSFYLSLIVNLNANDDPVSLIFGVTCFSFLGINYHVIGSQRDRKSNSFPRNVSEVNYFYFCFYLQLNADTYNKTQFRVIPQTPNLRLFFSVRTGLRTKTCANILKCHLC